MTFIEEISTYTVKLKKNLMKELCTPFHSSKLKLEIRLKNNLYIELISILERELNLKLKNEVK